jgi:hypothetical protein
MGMYDYLVDEKYDTQVKLFYTPIYTNEPLYENQHTWHSGGNLITYQKYSLLPLKTMYYEYPNDFVILLKPIVNRFEAALVKNGQFHGFVRDGENTEGFSYYYSDRGEKLNINHAKQVRQYLNEYKLVYSDRENKKIEKFKEKWVQPLTVEQRIGELHQCYICEIQMKEDIDFQEFMVKDSLENIIQKLDELKTEYPLEFQKYLNKHDLEWKESSR